MACYPFLEADNRGPLLLEEACILLVSIPTQVCLPFEGLQGVNMATREQVVCDSSISEKCKENRCKTFIKRDEIFIYFYNSSLWRCDNTIFIVPPPHEKEWILRTEALWMTGRVRNKNPFT